MFCEIRLTHSLLEIDDEKVKHMIKAFLKRQKFVVERYVYGIERVNKWGEQVSPHIHYKFETNVEIKKNTLQKSFREFMKAYGYPVSGVKHYAIMLDIQPDDEERWWRYVLKEEGACIGCSSNMSEFVPNNLPLAVDERKLQIKRNLEARERYLDKDSFKGKMFDHFSTELKINQKRQFFIELIKYYQEKNKVPPFSKLEEYWIDYQILTGLITAEEYVDAFILGK